MSTLHVARSQAGVLHLPYHSSLTLARKVGQTDAHGDAATVTRVIEGRVSEGWRADRLLDSASKCVVFLRIVDDCVCVCVCVCACACVCVCVCVWVCARAVVDV
jgi:hypothetical protein